MLGTAEEVYEDVLSDYKSKTVTVDPHPLTGTPTVSIHPCQHAQVMKKVIDDWIEQGLTPRHDLASCHSKESWRRECSELFQTFMRKCRFLNPVTFVPFVYILLCQRILKASPSMLGKNDPRLLARSLVLKSCCTLYAQPKWDW